MYETIIIGSGPAGLMCAKRLKDCLVLEKNSEAAKKLLITGGGRCNITNNKAKDKFLNEVKNSLFLKPAISLFGPNEIMDYFEKNGILLKEETDNKIFPVSNKSVEIVDFLKKGVNIKYDVNVLEISFDNGFKIVTDEGDFGCKNLVIATGGKSYSHLGSSGDGYVFASTMGHKIVPIYPALVQLKTPDLISLVGLSIDVTLSVGDKSVTGPIIVTHKGISGPSAFKISEFIKDEVYINFLTGYTKERLFNEFKGFKQSFEVKTFLRGYFPEKIVHFLLSISEIDESLKLASISKIKRDILFNNIISFKLNITSKGSLEEAIVTGGGVDVLNVNKETMESSIIKNLYFVGEVLDIHGPTGGYNITIALSTGNLAGHAIANK